MKAFISWSGERSKQTAAAIYDWIRIVIQAVEPWMSSEDIQKGSKSLDSIVTQLEEIRLGIICLNRENLNDAKWLVFEAGALSKTKDALVCTFLLDIKPTDVTPPLSMFQHTIFDKEDVKKLVFTINNKLDPTKDRKIEQSVLNTIFENSWHILEEQLNIIKEQSSGVDVGERSDRELIEEILTLVRDTNNSMDKAISAFAQLKPNLFDNYGYWGINDNNHVLSPFSANNPFKSFYQQEVLNFDETEEGK